MGVAVSRRACLWRAIAVFAAALLIATGLVLWHSAPVAEADAEPENRTTA